MSAVILRDETLPSESSAVTVTPMHMLQMAVEQNADIDKLQKLMDLQERWEANQAKQRFNEAFSAFKAEAIKIIKRTQVKDGPLKGKFHANLFDVVDAVTPKLSLHGLAISWKLTKDEKDWMEVTCILRHAGGHSETVSMCSAPDSGPGRNAIQARASAKSYLERYTATAILGLAAQDADDDGKGAGGGIEYITDNQALDLQAMAEEIGVDRDAFLKYLGIERLAELPAKRFKDAVAALNKKRKQS